MKSRFGVAADWLLAYADLEPYYVEVERFLGVAGPGEAGDRWRSAPYPLPAHPLCRASRKLGSGAAALGLDWDANPRCAIERGLANASGQVGRNFLESVAWTSVGLADEALLGFGGLPADAISWRYNRPDAVAGVIGGFRLSAAIHVADMIGPIAHAQRAVRGSGREHKRQMRRALGSTVAVGAVGESLPNEQSFVDLDPRQRDSLGRPLGRIHSYVDAMAVKRLNVMAGAARSLLEASGAAVLVEEFGTCDHFSSAHVFGTCRMGADPRSSVVDADLRAHGFSNLYACDASVLPSSGGGEAPSLTIQALALRAGDRIA